MSSAILSIMNDCELKSVTSTPKHTLNRTYNPTLNFFVHKTTTATTIEDLSYACSLIRDHYGFDFFSLLLRLNRFGNSPICYFVRDLNDSWTHYYQENKCILYDPGIRVSTSSVTPFLWSRHAFGDWGKTLSSYEADHCDQAFSFGMKDVFNAPFIGKPGDYGLIRFVRYATGQASDGDVIINQHRIPELYYLSSHIYQSLSRVFGNTEPQPLLSQREKDVLLWAAHGKNPATIAYKLKISDNTVCKHLSNIRKKLKVRNTTHAVAKSISTGLINI